jgi:uncharacterized protein (TIGR02231 family)
MNINVTHKPQSVTVYPSQARVMTAGSAELPAGRHTLVIDNLPLTTNVESIRVSGKGTGRVLILGVDVKRAHFMTSPAARVAELEAEIEVVSDELRTITDEREALLTQSLLLDGIRDNSVEFARSLSRGRGTVDEQAERMAFLLDQDRATKTAIRDADGTIRDLSRQIDKLKRELKEVQSARPNTSYQALVEVEADDDCEFRPNLTYTVSKAGWQPLYDARLLEDDTQTLAITYLAQVTNRSGQDWEAVELSVSTARPALNQRKPELRPWYIAERKPMPRHAKVRAMPSRAVADAPMMESALAPASAAMEVAAEAVVADVETSGTSVTFRISGLTTVPCDGSAHKNTVGQFNFKPTLDYVTVPRHTDSVFRRVKVANESGSPLLAGSVNLFAGDEYIGNNRIDYTAPSAEIELLLGVEERIVVERELVRRDVDKKLLRDQRQIRYGYKIELENLLPFSAEISVEDQIPVSKHEEIKVKLESANPQPAETSDLNIMQWQLRLDSGTKRTINYEFSIQHPRSIELQGIAE